MMPKYKTIAIFMIVGILACRADRIIYSSHYYSFPKVSFLLEWPEDSRISGRPELDIVPISIAVDGNIIDPIIEEVYYRPGERTNLEGFNTFIAEVSLGDFIFIEGYIDPEHKCRAATYKINKGARLIEVRYRIKLASGEMSSAIYKVTSREK